MQSSNADAQSTQRHHNSSQELALSALFPSQLPQQNQQMPQKDSTNVPLYQHFGAGASAYGSGISQQHLLSICSDQPRLTPAVAHHWYQ